MTCRILYLIGQLGPGGSERQLYYLLQTMDRRRYRPEVVVWNFDEHDTYVSKIRALRVPIHSLPTTSTKAEKLRAFRHLIRRLEPRLVHSYSSHTNFAAWWAALGTRIIPVGTVRGDFLQEKNGSPRWYSAINFRWPRSQIYNSFSAAETAKISKSLFAPSQIIVVSNGLDLEHFSMIPLKVTGRVGIVGIGSLLPVKRWNRILGAAFELKQRKLDCVIQIAGEGPSRKGLEQEARRLGIDDSVSLIGHYDDIPGLLAGASFLVHTSDSEGCPNVVMEAMACGRAVIATDAGDVRSLIDEGKTGFVVRCADQKTLVERMATLIRNWELCRRMGEAGRAKAEREFGLNRLVCQTLAAYRAAGWNDVRLQ